MRLWVVFVMAALVGCGEGLRTLTRDDVVGIPPGDAVGMQYSGEYLTASNKLEDCHCRSGSCAVVTGETGVTTQVLQTDGLLQMTIAITGVLAEGGVNADGHYTLGAAIEAVNPQYALVKGRFTLSGGIPSTMTGVQELTFRSGVFDCDIRSSFLCTYVGPLAAAGAQPARAAAAASGMAGEALGLVGVAADAHR
jgi:hypothetical protein